MRIFLLPAPCFASHTARSSTSSYNSNSLLASDPGTIYRARTAHTASQLTAPRASWLTASQLKAPRLTAHRHQMPHTVPCKQRQSGTSTQQHSSQGHGSQNQGSQYHSSHGLGSLTARCSQSQSSQLAAHSITACSEAHSSQLAAHGVKAHIIRASKFTSHSAQHRALSQRTTRWRGREPEIRRWQIERTYWELRSRIRLSFNGELALVLVDHFFVITDQSITATHHQSSYCHSITASRLILSQHYNTTATHRHISQNHSNQFHFLTDHSPHHHCCGACRL